MMNKVEQQVIDTIAEVGGVKPEDITPDADLYSLGIDSLSALEILAALEEEFKITIPQQRLKDLTGVARITAIVIELKSTDEQVINGDL